MTDLVVVNANVIPMTDEDLVLERAYISIRNGVVVEIDLMTELNAFPEEQMIDLCGRYALPGLIDLHTHVVEEPRTHLARHRTITNDSPLIVGVRAFRNLQEALQAGITTVCDCGSPNDFTLQLRRAIEMGVIEGPRLFVCGPLLTGPGGHGAELGLEIAGEELPKAIRELADLNVNFVKVINDPIIYTQSDLTEAVLQAHRLGLSMACHAFTEDAIWLALLAGCDSIEHGVAYSAEMLSYVQEKGVGIIPTYISALKSSVDLDKSLVSQEDADQYFYPWLELLRRQLPSCLNARDVLIGAGTDAGFPPIHFASLIEEIQAFVEMGASTFQALSSATRSASEIRGLSSTLGTIQTGKAADIIVVDRNPLEDISSLAHVSVVVKGGRLVKNRLTRSGAG